jgi:hypothetical protein
MAEFINQLVRRYMSLPEIREKYGGIKKEKPTIISDEDAQKLMEVEDKSVCLETIRQKILENPDRWLVPVKTKRRKYDDGLAREILNQVRLDCSIKPTIIEVRGVFEEVYKSFDATEYVKKRQK